MSSPARPLAPVRPSSRWLAADAFLAAVRAGTVPAGAGLALIAAADAANDRLIDFTAGSASANRNGWRIDLAGLDLATYRRNPVVLWAHDDTSLPLGRAVRVVVEGDRIRARVEFTPAGALSFNDKVVDLLKGGFLSGMSVGLIPLDWEYQDAKPDGQVLVFTRSQLVELSVVPIPADAGALADQATACLSPHDAIEIARRRVALLELGVAGHSAEIAVIVARRAVLRDPHLTPEDRRRFRGQIAQIERRRRIADLTAP
ncbi:MAG: hypothetical protein EPN53_01015 [Acidobacteria bacterium]|nr:MAG: hypothetical protein EPN53_01015 [Acidobacteriota bacterium]